MSDVERFMRAALAEAEAAGRAGEVPIGAVVVRRGEIVGRGRKRDRERRTQLAHAELNALLDAGEAIWEDHDEAALFTTVEPCPMCLGATVMADVPAIYFAAHDPLAGARGALEIPYIRRHIRTYEGGILERESLALIEQNEPRLLAYLRRPG